MHFLSILIFGFLLFINPLAAGQIMKVTVDPIKCFNETSGSITITTDTAYTEALTIVIKDSTQSVIKQFYNKNQQPWQLNNLKPGQYTITLQTQENKVKEVKTVDIKNPDELKGNLITIIAAKEGESPVYSLKANPSGGTPPYNYIWSENANNQASQIAKELKEGTYTCKITDAHKCGPKTVTFLLYAPEIEKYKRSIKNK